MGLSHSKAHPRVTKVAPLQNKEEETPSACPVDFAFNRNLEEKSSYLLARLQDQNKALEGQLPPLRETWCGRYCAGTENSHRETVDLGQGKLDYLSECPGPCILTSHWNTEKQVLLKGIHPEGFKPVASQNCMSNGRDAHVMNYEDTGVFVEPKFWEAVGLQKLEPIDLPRVITSETLLSQHEARTTHRAKQELEKKMQTPGYTPGKRQYLHKMQMLEMNRNRQEKKSLHREARINQQKPRDHKAKKILQSIPRNDDRDLPTLLPDETLNRRSPGNSQNEDLGEHQARNDYCPRKTGKMETWLREQEARGQLLWDSSSSDSEELRKSERKPQALVRTRTERIPLFDEFFDRE